VLAARVYLRMHGPYRSNARERGPVFRLPMRLAYLSYALLAASVIALWALALDATLQDRAPTRALPAFGAPTFAAPMAPTHVVTLVSGSSGEPASISLVSEAGSTFSCTTDARGRCTLEVVPGWYVAYGESAHAEVIPRRIPVIAAPEMTLHIAMRAR
jgi:hypothetical protein